MYAERMKRALVIALVAACGGTRAPESTYSTSAASGSASDDGGGERVGGGRFSRAQVEHAIDKETKALQLLDASLSEADDKDDGKDPDAPVRRAAMHADRVAGAAFAAQLAACLHDADDCPPSLDEPAIASDFDPASLSFKGTFAADVSKWPATATSIEAAACGCRTGACVAWVMADLDRWEAALPAAAQADESAATHVVGARECIWARLGKKAIAVPQPAEE